MEVVESMKHVFTPIGRYYIEHEGKQFTLIGKVDKSLIDDEILEAYAKNDNYPLYSVQLSTGEVIHVWHEEIF
jgi:hypothetical protein